MAAGTMCSVWRKCIVHKRRWNHSPIIILPSIVYFHIKNICISAYQSAFEYSDDFMIILRLVWVRTFADCGATGCTFGCDLQYLQEGRAVLRECCRDDGERQRGKAKFDPAAPNPLTDRHLNLLKWFRRRYRSSCNILFRSDNRFCSRASNCILGYF